MNCLRALSPGPQTGAPLFALGSFLTLQVPLALLGRTLSLPAPLCSRFLSPHPAGLTAGEKAANTVRPLRRGAQDALPSREQPAQGVPSPLTLLWSQRKAVPPGRPRPSAHFTSEGRRESRGTVLGFRLLSRLPAHVPPWISPRGLASQSRWLRSSRAQTISDSVLLP